MARQLSPDDEGKPVVGTDGRRLGTVLEVTDEEVLIAPTPDASDASEEIVEPGEQNSGFSPDRIEAVTDDEIRLDV